MAREKKPVHKVQMTERKRNIIRQLLEEYDIESSQDIQDALKDLLGGTIKEMMEAEMDDHLGYSKSECSDSDDYRNGYKTKRVNSSYGSMEIEVPQDRKPFCADLKTIYQAPTEEKALDAWERDTEKWSEKYPNSMKSWKQNWDAISPIFKFSAEARKVIYTTNAIESLNATFRKLNRQRSVFPSDTALLKALYLSTFEATKKWTMPLRNWGQVYGELSIMYEGRLPE